MQDRPSSLFVVKKQAPKFKRGALLLDDKFCRLYIVLRSWWSPTIHGGNAFRCLIVADWSSDDMKPNVPGEIVTFGPCVDNDKLMLYLQLPDEM